MLYPLAATPNKADQFRSEPTLDGLAFMRLSQPSDVTAIEWIRANVNPEAVVVESSGGSYSSEGAGRVSMATGNPTLLGWDFHEMQWRGDAYGEMVAGRPEALDQIYRLAPPEELPGLLAKWDADFVYVGDLERRKFGMSDSTLSRLDRTLRRVYDWDGVIIYARDGHIRRRLWRERPLELLRSVTAGRSDWSHIYAGLTGRANLRLTGPGWSPLGPDEAQQALRALDAARAFDMEPIPPCTLQRLLFPIRDGIAHASGRR
jgi:hypothetical protein